MTETIKLLELFSGIQSQERALRQLGIPYESIGVCDCDKDVLVASAAMRFDLEKEIVNYDFPDTETMIKELQDKNIGYSFKKQKHTITSRTPIPKLKQYYISDKLLKNLGDISKVERLPRANFVTYSSPCQSFSVAGKLAGAAKTCTKCGHKWDIDFSNPDYNYKCPVCGNASLESTTSGLLQEVQRLLSIAYEENELPEYLMLENVKNLVQKKFIGQFNAWVKWLDSIGYNTYYKVLNAKHFGICQNRERVFAISIRKDIDKNSFTFPEPIPLTTRLKDILEHNVDEKYYLPDERAEEVVETAIKNGKLQQLIDQNIIDDFFHSRDERIYDDGAPTLRINCNGLKVLEPFCVASRGRNPENPSDRTTGAPTEQRLEPKFDGATNCLTSVAKDNYVIEPQMLRAERTEYGKAIRQQYESGEVDEKIGNMRELSPRTDGISNTVTTVQKDNYVFEPIEVLEPNRIGNIYGEQFGTGYAGNVWDKNSISPTLMTMQGGNRQPIIVEAEIKPELVGGIGEKNFGKQYRQGNRVYSSDAIAMALNAQPVGNTGGNSYLYAVRDQIVYDDYNSRIKEDQSTMTTLTTNCGAIAPRNGVKIIESHTNEIIGCIYWRIRKLTPRETWRLMNFTDEDNERASKFVADSQLYKQAGNSIVVACLIAIFSSLFVENGHQSDVWTKYQLNYFD